MENKYFRRGFGLKDEVTQQLKGDYHSAVIEYLKSSNYIFTIGETTIKLAREFGFCYGVDRSIEYAYQSHRSEEDFRRQMPAEMSDLHYGRSRCGSSCIAYPGRRMACSRHHAAGRKTRPVGIE